MRQPRLQSGVLPAGGVFVFQGFGLADTNGTVSTVEQRPETIERVVEVPQLREVELNDATAHMLIASPEFPVGQPCPHCCHWILPSVAQQRIVTMDGRTATRFAVVLRYHEWLAYHHHIVTHQGLDRRMQVHVS